MAKRQVKPYQYMLGRNKYKNHKIVIDNIEFDSKREAKRYEILKDLLLKGEITDLEMQKKYILIPAQYEPDTIGPRGGIKKGKTIERECAYMADFVYTDKDGNTVVEDTKGFRTADYTIKRKLMLYIHGIRIQEI